MASPSLDKAKTQLEKVPSNPF